MIVGVPKESYPAERRVALVPMVLPNLVKAGFEIIIEAGAGEQAGYPDSDYVDRGAKALPERAALFSLRTLRRCRAIPCRPLGRTAAGRLPAKHGALRQ